MRFLVCCPSEFPYRALIPLLALTKVFPCRAFCSYFRSNNTVLHSDILPIYQLLYKLTYPPDSREASLHLSRAPLGDYAEANSTITEKAVCKILRITVCYTTICPIIVPSDSFVSIKSGICGVCEPKLTRFFYIYTSFISTV